MEKILKYIIFAFQNFWNEIAIIYKNESITYIKLLKESIRLSCEFNKFWRKDKKLVIALCAENSIEWIVAFLGTIFSNNILVISSPSKSDQVILHTLSDVDILIIDQQRITPKIKEKFRGIIMYTKHIRPYVNEVKLKTLYRIILKDKLLNDADGEIVMYTPNKLKKVRIELSDVLVLLKELKSKEIYKSKTDYLVHISFNYNYIIGMLLPLISNTKIIIEPIMTGTKFYSYYTMEYGFEKYKPPVVILTANQFNIIYKIYVLNESVSIKEYIIAILSIRWKLKSINNLIIKARLAKLFPKIEKLIIINSSIPLHLEKTLKLIEFPYTVTYGTVETCGIATYSHPSEFKIESVGRDITGTLMIVDNAIMHHRRDSEISFNDPLNDMGLKDINGNIHFICRGSDYSIKSSRIESIIKEIPFVAECIIYESFEPNELPYLLVNIDYEQVEEIGLTTKKEVHEIISNFIKKLSIPISKIILWNPEFPRDDYGRIVKARL